MPGAKQPSLEVAASVAEAAKKTGGAYVFSSLSKSILREENASAIIQGNKFAEFACADCGTEFAALEATSPFCITCGSEHVRKGAEKAQSIHPDSDLVSVTCTACNSINITHSEISSAAKGGLHCASCGTELMNLQVKAGDETPADDEVSAEDLDVVDVDEESAADDKKDEKKEEKSEDKKDDKKEEKSEDKKEDKKEEKSDDTHDTAPEMSAGKDEDKKEEKSEDKKDDKKDEKKEEKSEGKDPGSKDREVEKSDDKKEDKKDDKKDEANADEMPYNDEEAEDVDMVDMVDEDNVNEMALVSMAGHYVIMANLQSIAKLSEETAGDNKDVFNTKQFQEAILGSLQKDGLRKTIAAFKFVPLKVKARVKKHVAKLVQAGVEEKGASLKDQQTNLSKAWKQSVDIAATGINKKFFKGVANPLAQALVSELTTMGVKGAEKIVSRLFEKSGMEYSAALIKQAEVLLAKSQEMRDELADVLNITGVLAAEEDLDGEDNLGDEMSAVTAVTEEKAQQIMKEKGRETASPRKGSQIASLGALFAD